MFDMLECGGKDCHGDGRSENIMAELLSFIRGEDVGEKADNGIGNGFGKLFPEIRGEGSRMPREGKRDPDRITRALNAVSALTADPDPSPITSIFSNPLNGQGVLPDQISTGPQSINELTTFGADISPLDPGANDLNATIRRLLRNLG